MDGLIVYFFNFVWGFIFGFAAGFISSVTGNNINIKGGIFHTIVTLGVSAIAIFYYIYFIGRFGQTLGKRWLGVKVVKVGTNEAPGYSKAFLREIVGKIASMLVLFLGFLWMLWDPQKQTWHDKIAGTIVVKV